jgi:hypothetical protein
MTKYNVKQINNLTRAAETALRDLLMHAFKDGIALNLVDIQVRSYHPISPEDTEGDLGFRFTTYSTELVKGDTSWEWEEVTRLIEDDIGTLPEDPGDHNQIGQVGQDQGLFKKLRPVSLETLAHNPEGVYAAIVNAVRNNNDDSGDNNDLSEK